MNEDEESGTRDIEADRAGWVRVELMVRPPVVWVWVEAMHKG